MKKVSVLLAMVIFFIASCNFSGTGTEGNVKDSVNVDTVPVKVDSTITTGTGDSVKPVDPSQIIK